MDERTRLSGQFVALRDRNKAAIGLAMSKIALACYDLENHLEKKATDPAINDDLIKSAIQSLSFVLGQLEEMN